MFNCDQFRKLIIKPSLEKVGLYSEDAEELLVFTCAAESLGGTYLEQVGGLALGIFQFEVATHKDLWRNFLAYKKDLLAIFNYELGIMTQPLSSRLVYDLEYATIMARLQYYRQKEALPSRYNLHSIWEYYKKYYNTPLGKARQDEAISKYRLFTKSG